MTQVTNNVIKNDTTYVQFSYRKTSLEKKKKNHIERPSTQIMFIKNDLTLNQKD